jgi:single-stranded-DNA-specific exonuclease
LVKSQAHLLHSFGGHPFAAGLSLPLENLPIFREAIEQRAFQLFPDLSELQPTIKADLTVTVAELGRDLFAELSLLEPYGMGNPVPKLLLRKCWFRNVYNQNIVDIQKKQVKYLKTTFKICDQSNETGFAGIWWGHQKEDLPQNKTLYDAIVELDFNSSATKDGKKRYYGNEGYQVRLLAVRKAKEELVDYFSESETTIIDLRDRSIDPQDLLIQKSPYIIIEKTPTNWDELIKNYDCAIQSKRNLVLAYSHSLETRSSQEIWQRLVGIAKYLSRLERAITLEKLERELTLSNRCLKLGLELLKEIGFNYQIDRDQIIFQLPKQYREINYSSIELFFNAIAEEQFQRQYFDRVPLTTIQNNLRSRSLSIQ